MSIPTPYPFHNPTSYDQVILTGLCRLKRSDDMKIRYLHEILSRNEEIKVIGKSVKLDGVTCNVMGIVRHGMEMRLFILLYDESFQQRIEEREAVERFDAPGIPESNRMLMHLDRRIDANNPFQSVLKVFIGEREFRVNSTEFRRLSAQDWEHLLIIAKFLQNGWQPNELDDQNIDMLCLTSLILDGDDHSIPAFNENLKIRFVMRPRHVVHQVERPITLVVGGKYPDKLMFRDTTTGAEHWVQINRVYLSDVWEEMDKVFTNPKLQEHMTPEEINQARLDFEKKFSEVCPRGMYFPVIEYECEEDISLQFFSKAYLDAKPLHRGSSMGFIVRPDQPTGILGLQLKATVIQEPVPANTHTIEAELFQYIHMTTDDDILL